MGVASRREADVRIAAGHVLVNGKPAVIGQMVSETDQIKVTGTTKDKSYYAYYKGRGVVTHGGDDEERDVLTRIQKEHGLAHVAPIGRLPKGAEGLLILSDDGRVTAPLLDPEAGHEKEYDVTVDKNISPMFQRVMASGVDIEGYRTKPARLIPHEANEKRFRIILTEGKKHQLDRMCAALGYQVETLKRVRVLNIELGKLKPNQYRKITGEELKVFLKTLGI